MSTETGPADLVGQDELNQLVLQHEAEQLLYAYQDRVDHKDLTGLAEVFHPPDAVLERQDGPRTGRDAVIDLYRAFADSDVTNAQHNGYNVRVSETDTAGVLRVDSCFLAITTHASGGARYVWGRYRDDMVHHEGRWVYLVKRILIGRTLLIAEDQLAPPLARDSFGAMTD